MQLFSPYFEVLLSVFKNYYAAKSTFSCYLIISLITFCQPSKHCILIQQVHMKQSLLGMFHNNVKNAPSALHINSYYIDNFFLLKIVPVLVNSFLELVE